MLLARQSRSRRPRFGIIGTGQIVQMMRKALLSTPTLEVAAIAGREPTSAGQLAEAFGGIKACQDYRELLSLDLDAVFIATPPHLHAEMSEAALAAGMHVVCEKPLVRNLDELTRLEAAHRSNPHLKFASCSSRFFVCPPVREARQWILDGRFGRILTVRVQVSTEFPPPVAALPAWKQRWGTTGGGLVMDWGVYDLDWLRYLLGNLFRPLSVSGAIDYWRAEGSGLETGYFAHIRCEGHLTILLERKPEHGPTHHTIQIRGTEAGADLPFMPGALPDRLVYYRRSDKNDLQPELTTVTMNDWDTILSFPVIDMAEAITANREVASPLGEQRFIYQTIDALYQSAAAGQSALLAPEFWPTDSQA